VGLHQAAPLQLFQDGHNVGEFRQSGQVVGVEGCAAQGGQHRENLLLRFRERVKRFRRQRLGGRRGLHLAGYLRQRTSLLPRHRRRLEKTQRVAIQGGA
jgi:hypothetical protein